ncbi:MAG: TetR/AcrR family transcriptional regulator [Clostridia bacterium]|nr:TetR/AcrR family transcriptional regulator [Clostridia bacterium]
MAKKKGEKYDAILGAAVKVIAVNGYGNSQISKIAKEAGVADGTVYLYFDSKEEMMVDVFNEFLGGFIEEIRHEMSEITNTADKLKKLVEAHLTKLENDHDLAIVCLVELRRPDPQLRQATGDVLRRYFHLIEDLIEEGQASGFFNPELNKYLARQMIFGTLDEIVISWVFNRRHSLAAQAPQVYKMLLNSLTGHSRQCS